MTTKQFYENVARRHRLFYADWQATVRGEGRWLDELFRPFGVRRILDCTCGIGTQALGLSLLDYEVTASDLSTENLAEAQRAAQALGASVAWHQADVRRLDQASISGPFDAVLSVGNSLPHLLTEQDMLEALRQMHDQVRPGGVVLVGQRDWDAIQRQRPHGSLRHVHRDTPEPGRRTVLFDLWQYDDPLIIFEVFFLEELDTGWNVEVYPLRYRMWQRRELVELMEEAGLIDVRQVDHDWEVRLLGRRPA